MTNRQSQHEQLYQQSALQINLPVSKQLSRLVKAENHLFNRMMTHPMILNDYRLREDFNFDTPELQVLYRILCENGEVTPQELSELPEHVQHAWYLMLEEDLPEEVADNELIEVESIRNKELLRKENQLISKKIREASHNGDVETAIEELERLIAQKRRME